MLWVTRTPQPGGRRGRSGRPCCGWRHSAFTVPGCLPPWFLPSSRACTLLTAPWMPAEADLERLRLQSAVRITTAGVVTLPPPWMPSTTPYLDVYFPGRELSSDTTDKHFEKVLPGRIVRFCCSLFPFCQQLSCHFLHLFC